MSHLMSYFLLSRRIYSEKCTKSIKIIHNFKGFQNFYTLRNCVVFCTETHFSKLRNGLEIL